AATKIEEIEALCNEISSTDPQDDEVAFRGSARYVLRLVHRDLGDAKPQSIFRQDATYLITGGLGALGRHVAQWMTERGARHIVLVGRPTRTDHDEIEGSVFRAIDISAKDQVARLLQETSKSMPPLRGIIHAAGILDDSLVQNLNEQRL